MRKPFMIAALVVAVLIVALEIGSGFAIGVGGDAAPPDSLPRPGLGIQFLALLDAQLLFLVLSLAAPLFVSDGFQARVQGVSTALFGLIVAILSFFSILAAFTLLMLMVSLLLAAPFGTAIYLAGFGAFERGDARVALSALVMLKVALGVLLVLSRESFIKHSPLVRLSLYCLGATVLVSFLHGFVPSFLSSITDAVAALVIAIVALLRGVVILIASLPSVLRALKVGKAGEGAT